VKGRGQLSVSVPSIPAGRRHVVHARIDGFEAPPPPRGFPAGLRSGLLRQLVGVAPDEPAPCILRGAHFSGNLVVVVNTERPVERHLLRAVGLQGGRANLAAFFVGDGQPDHYRFRVEAPSADWQVSLFHEDERVGDEGLYTSQAAMLVSIGPPPRAYEGRLTIHVSRATVGCTVPVEFELLAGAVPLHARHLAM
jgi:hypothetical protein